ncbi:MAG: shikimate dehydrogenase [Peptostreptococcaceae bacterium]
MKINAKTKIICLIGNPIEHSLSPNIQNYLLNQYDINANYVCFRVEKENLKEAINGVKNLGIQGCNITIPHKVKVMKYLDEVDKNAKLIGAVNTVKNEDGKLIGYNTDGIGFVKSITDKGYELKNKKVLIIGAGGACRSIAVELASNGVKTIDIRNRSLENAEIIAGIVCDNFNTKVKYSSDSVTKNDLEKIDIIINTTPIGMDKDKESCPIDNTINVEKHIIVCDIVYNPHETEFIKWGKKNNLEIVYGRDMLINQAVHSFFIWTDINVGSNINFKNILKGR